MLAAPPLALAASPARVSLVAPASRTVDVRNAGAAALVVSVAMPGRLLTVRPDRFVLPPKATAVLTLRLPALRSHTASVLRLKSGQQV